MALKGTDERAQTSLNIVDSIVGQIGDVTDEAKASGIFRRWLTFQQSFWRYSAYNVMLMAFQARQHGLNLSRVGGSTKWTSLGRKVKSEEWGRRLWILAPVFKKVEKNGEERSVLVGFRSVYVFDQSQTEGADLPTLDYRAQGEDAGLVTALEGVARDHKVEVQYADPALMDALYGAECNGVCMNGGKTIRVRNTLQGAERAGTLAHELAHSFLHFGNDGKLDLDHSRSVKEIEAESVAACVLGAWGLEWRQSAFYIACWEGDKEKVKASMTRIANTSKNILSSILPEEKGE
jgi:hypothetical protein